MLTKLTQKLNELANTKLVYVILLSPITAYWIHWMLNPTFWHPSDPGVWYFLDSLAVFKGLPYTYIDHPGTPLHLAGSLLLALTYPFFKNHQAFIDYHISEPELFFVMANTLLAVLNGVTAILFYKTATETVQTNKVMAGLALSLMFFGLHPQSVESITFWSHNSLNYPLGTLWLLSLYRAVKQPTLPGWKKLIVLGMWIGATSMAQIYLLAWAGAGVLVIFVLAIKTQMPTGRAIGHAAIFAMGNLLGILAMLVPIWAAIPRFVNWVWQILTKRGLYGTGESGFYSLDLIPQSIAFWYASLPIMVIFFLLMLMALFSSLIQVWRGKINLPTPTYAMLFGFAAQLAVLLLLFSKLYPKTRYMLSVAAIIPVVFLILIPALEKLLGQKVWLLCLFYGAVLGASLISTNQEIQHQSLRAFVQQDAAVTRSLAVATLAQIRNVPEDNIVVVYGYATPVKCAGLLIANNWIRAFDKELEQLCPNQYSLYDSQIEIDFNTPHQMPKLDDIEWDMVVAPGNHTGLQDKLRQQGAVNIPNQWGVNRGSWFFIRP